MWNMVIAVATCLGAVASGAGVIVAVVAGRKEFVRLRESQVEHVRSAVEAVGERIDRLDRSSEGVSGF